MILDNFLTSLRRLLRGRRAHRSGVTATAVSTNTIDTAPTALGGNQPATSARRALEIAISTLAAATAAGAATVNFELIQADDAALTTNVETLVQTGPIPKATLTVGTVIALHYDRAAPLTPRRYVGVRYTVATGPLTAGTFSAAIVKNIADVANIYAKSGFLVS
jgi:hypothetical protein